MPFDRLAMSKPQYLLFLPTNPFLAAHSALWVSQAAVVKAGQTAYDVSNRVSSKMMTMKEYADMRKFYRNRISSPLNLIRVRTNSKTIKTRNTGSGDKIGSFSVLKDLSIGVRVRGLCIAVCFFGSKLFLAVA